MPARCAPPLPRDPLLPGELAAALRSLSSQGGAQYGDEGGTLPGLGSTRHTWGQWDRRCAAGRTQGCSLEPVTSLRPRGAEPPREPGAAAEGLDAAPSSRGAMAPGRGDAHRAWGAAGRCAAAQATLCKATAGHRQLVLQLGGSADGPRLREERRRRSAEARELSTGKEGAAAPGSGCGAPPAPTPGLVEGFWGRAGSVPPRPAGLRCALLAGLRQAPASPEERQELERLWVLFLSALELFLQDLRRAHHLCQLFSVQGGGAAPLRTGLGGPGLPGRKGSRRGGGSTQPPAAPRLEEEIEQVRAMLAEMESGANIPLWTVEATQPAGTGGTAAPAAGAALGGSRTGHCCRVL